MGEKEREGGRKERGGIKGKRESRHGEQRGRGIPYFQCLYNSEAKNVHLSRANTDPVNPYGDVSFACGHERRGR